MRQGRAFGFSSWDRRSAPEGEGVRTVDPACTRPPSVATILGGTRGRLEVATGLSEQVGGHVGLGDGLMPSVGAQPFPRLVDGLLATRLIHAEQDPRPHGQGGQRVRQAARAALGLQRGQRLDERRVAVALGQRDDGLGDQQRGGGAGLALRDARGRVRSGSAGRRRCRRAAPGSRASSAAVHVTSARSFRSRHSTNASRRSRSASSRRPASRWIAPRSPSALASSHRAPNSRSVPSGGLRVLRGPPPAAAAGGASRPRPRARRPP